MEICVGLRYNSKNKSCLTLHKGRENMIVGFLDLLGFSQLLDLSTEAAIDNVNSFNNEIKTRVMDNISHPIEEYKTNYPDDLHFQKFVEKSAVSSFDYLISFSDSLILGSNRVELFIEQLCNLVSSLYIYSSEPFTIQFGDVFNVDNNKIVSYENGGLRKHKAFPILFRGGLSVGDECFFFKENSIQNGKFCYDGYNVFGRTYLNAVRLEHSGKGPRLFCDKSVVDSMQNRRIIRMVNEEKNIFEIVWTIEGCEATGCCSSNSWRNVLDRIDSKLLPAAINFAKFYSSDQKYIDVLPQYKELLKLVCCGIVKYAKDKCNKGEEALEKINSVLRIKRLGEYTLSDLLSGFIE